MKVNALCYVLCISIQIDFETTWKMERNLYEIVAPILHINSQINSSAWCNLFSWWKLLEILDQRIFWGRLFQGKEWPGFKAKVPILWINWNKKIAYLFKILCRCLKPIQPLSQLYYSVPYWSSVPGYTTYKPLDKLSSINLRILVSPQLCKFLALFILRIVEKWMMMMMMMMMMMISLFNESLHKTHKMQ